MKARPLAPGRPRHSRPTGVYLLLSALAASVMMSVVIGARPTDLTALMGLLDGRIDSIDEAAIASRLPRTLLALLAGAALAVAGATMQGLTRNPLADPGLLGVNAGASLAVVIGIAWFAMQHVAEYLWVAVLGAAGLAIGLALQGTLSNIAAGVMILILRPLKIDEFIEAVRKNLLCSKGSSGEKNKLMLSSLDDFRDGKAAERASDIISNYLRTGRPLKNVEDQT